jgi:hypothetical protein
MSLTDELEALQARLSALALAPADEVLERYTMSRPRRPPGLYWQLRWLAGRALRWLQSTGILHANPWPVGLAHSGSRRHAKPILIWAVGADRNDLHKACSGLSGFLETLPGYAPVLITDHADFAFFSRLGWLVEYLPDVSGEGEPFAARKERFLARLYRGAPAVPLSAGLALGSNGDELRKWLRRRAAK